MWDKSRDAVFVAGASGAIGRRLCALLCADGWHVFGGTRRAERASRVREFGAEPIVFDVLDPAATLDALMRVRPAIVIHQLTDLPPALDPARMADAIERNARLREVGTRHLVMAAAKIGARRLIAQSVAFAYAPGARPFVEQMPLDLQAEAELRRRSAQGVSTLEQQVLSAPMPGVVLRYGKLYGPGTGFDQPATDGPVHVDAAAEAARLAITRGEPGVYNIAEEDGAVDCARAKEHLNWRADFRIRCEAGAFA